MKDAKIDENGLPDWKWVICRLAGELSSSPAYIAAASAAVRGMVRRRGTMAGQKLAEQCIGLAGFPFQRWLGIEDNIHSQAMRMRLWNRTGPFRPVPKRPAVVRDGPLRVGYVSELGRGGDPAWAHCTMFPEDSRLFIFSTRKWEEFDVPRLPHVSLSSFVLSRVPGLQAARYGAEREHYEQEMRRLAREVNACDLDILLLASFHLDEVNDLAMLVDTPCIVVRLFGSAPSFHPKVDYCLYCQLHSSFPIVGTDMRSVFTGKSMGAEPCLNGMGPLYPDWGLTPENNPAWEDRPPWLLFHGNLVQLQGSRYLALIGDILEADREVRFRILGFGEGLSTVMDTFARRGLSGQVQYLGEVDKALQRTGEFQKRITSFLRDGRLEPDPWPWGGGQARVEAYQAGTPTVHLRIDSTGGVPSDEQMEFDVPDLEVPSATASSLEEYRNLCLKCLYDGDFARKVAQEQYSIARRVTDARAWWDNFFASYRHWLHGTGWAAGLPSAGGRRA